MGPAGLSPQVPLILRKLPEHQVGLTGARLHPHRSRRGRARRGGPARLAARRRRLVRDHRQRGGHVDLPRPRRRAGAAHRARRRAAPKRRAAAPATRAIGQPWQPDHVAIGHEPHRRLLPKRVVDCAPGRSLRRPLVRTCLVLAWPVCTRGLPRRRADSGHDDAAAGHARGGPQRAGLHGDARPRAKVGARTPDRPPLPHERRGGHAEGPGRRHHAADVARRRGRAHEMEPPRDREVGQRGARRRQGAADPRAVLRGGAEGVERADVGIRRAQGELARAGRARLLPRDHRQVRRVPR
mmetsp:Transcript_100730/g.307957  ORF Transcript_100730/g.307957 Transcript_100730/m.307957 type:complete len:297 (+) Transcript_100730:209-1099(+)